MSLHMTGPHPRTRRITRKFIEPRTSQAHPLSKNRHFHFHACPRLGFRVLWVEFYNAVYGVECVAVHVEEFALPGCACEKCCGESVGVEVEGALFLEIDEVYVIVFGAVEICSAWRSLAGTRSR